MYHSVSCISVSCIIVYHVSVYHVRKSISCYGTMLHANQNLQVQCNSQVISLSDITEVTNSRAIYRINTLINDNKLLCMYTAILN